MDFVSAKFIFVALLLVSTLAYWLFNFIILYHLTRFGVGTEPKKFAVVFLLGSVCLFFVSAVFFVSIDLTTLKNQFEKISSSLFNITNTQ
ncbi:MAG: hypothetical protein A3A96_03125 [Candidatus Zambryskibacteria bacterium RIFCSPLOWO2_01_FULL_39_39]|uniref:Uncharacterized protein n=1 Tax=Candidatus Zambryskibacteria bacterium RIFCSPLOWO2_01_FULL_39_39 TaxID=1802758 RepID=A0A1G2TWT6_9BACT|nr:MAG: hypothetical protein A2644_02515 [Candidatus Zambryskibacteria bacterium RIFCSPHIGHO2_01_FULL_39_63]OHA94413.1 MAG: hypothetical protein A3B88_01800 [Candidatus Zambryskibacteria bacterium RIFCSPHIGHO2_02_FULL_39_19]OHA98775.1 MAG: hypothetical protein A3F20_00810 [Candidatus Zambryskibacteria bacterium RIFCSPHIGHO2_12_FULL_39_21]OHB01633.1 MAG: hypothetical protein A3A96_03125 [Candidatus Zambryskibacteria bacterium RIFCSPLOWO2_01_FULL_39_39]